MILLSTTILCTSEPPRQPNQPSGTGPANTEPFTSNITVSRPLVFLAQSTINHLAPKALSPVLKQAPMLSSSLACTPLFFTETEQTKCSLAFFWTEEAATVKNKLKNLAVPFNLIWREYFTFVWLQPFSRLTAVQLNLSLPREQTFHWRLLTSTFQYFST